MATRLLLEELLSGYEVSSGRRVKLESVGGVEAARRIDAGECFDLAILASGAIEKLITSGSLVSGSRVDLVRSGVAVAVKAGAPEPDIGSEQALRDAILSAKTLSYSTGPSGVALAELFSRWEIDRALDGRIVVPPPGRRSARCWPGVTLNWASSNCRS